MFETTGQVELAEILFDGTRSKGCGVVQFAQVAEAETAIGMIQFSSDPHNTQRSFSFQLNFNSICTVDGLLVR